MRIDVDVNASIPPVLKQSSISKAVRKGINEAGHVLLKESKDIMQKGIYDVPITTGKDGKPLWKRTGRLMKGERFQTLSNTSGKVTNPTKYTEERHALDHTSPRDGINRRCKWRELTMTAAERKAVEKMKSTIRKELGF